MYSKFFFFIYIIGLSFSYTTYAKEINVNPYVKYTYEIKTRQNPSDALLSSEHTLNNLIYSGLFTVTNDFNYKSELIDKYSFNYLKGYLEFNIRSNARFHDGSFIRLNDVLKSLIYLIKESSNKTSFSSITKIIIYNGKIRIYSNFNEPLVPLLSSPLVKIWKSKDNKLLGSGPYYIQDYNKKKEVLYLKKFVSHFDSSSYIIEQFEIHKVTEKVAIEKLNNGIGMDMADFVINNPLTHNFTNKVVKIQKPIAASWIIAFNLKDEILFENKIRNCLNTYFPRDTFIKKFLPVHKSSINYIPPNLMLHNTSTDSNENGKNSCLNLNIKKELVLDYPNELDDAEKQCSFIQNHFQTVGIVIRCNLIDFDTLLTKIIKKKWQLSLLAMAAEVPSVNYLANSFYSKSRFNILNNKIKELDLLIENVNKSNSKEIRFDLFRKINDFVKDNNLVLTISHPSHFTIINNCVKNFNLNSFGPSFLSYAGIWTDLRCYNGK